MKKLIAALAVVCALTSVLPSTAAASTEGRIATLQKQVNALTKQVNTLRKDVNHANREVGINYVADACQAAVVADTIRNTWVVIDQIASAAQGVNKTYFGSQQVTNDQNACKDIGLTRAETQVPPPLSIFVALIDYLI
jgi:uncharacterized protein YoxC